MESALLQLLTFDISSGVEPVMSCQSAFCVEPVREQSSRTEAAGAGQQGSGRERKIGCIKSFYR